MSFLKLAISMATKAGALARELKSIKSDLCFMQERCNLLGEENRRLRDGIAKGIRPEEDDLVPFPSSFTADSKMENPKNPRPFFCICKLNLRDTKMNELRIDTLLFLVM